MVFLCSCGGLIWENRVHICGSVRCSCGGIKFEGRVHCCGYKPDYSIPPTDYEVWKGFRRFDEWTGSPTWEKRSPSLFGTKNQETMILNTSSSMNEIKNLQQTGSFQDYCNSFDFLLTKVVISDDYATSLFMGGLKHEIGAWVKLFGPKTLDEAYEMAKKQDKFLSIIHKEFKKVGNDFSSSNYQEEFGKIGIQPIDESENGVEMQETLDEDSGDREDSKEYEQEMGFSYQDSCVSKHIEKSEIGHEIQEISTYENDNGMSENEIGSLNQILSIQESIEDSEDELVPKMFDEKLNATKDDFNESVNEIIRNEVNHDERFSEVQIQNIDEPEKGIEVKETIDQVLIDDSKEDEIIGFDFHKTFGEIMINKEYFKNEKIHGNCDDSAQVSVEDKIIGVSIDVMNEQTDDEGVFDTSIDVIQELMVNAFLGSDMFVFKEKGINILHENGPLNQGKISEEKEASVDKSVTKIHSAHEQREVKANSIEGKVKMFPGLDSFEWEPGITSFMIRGEVQGIYKHLVTLVEPEMGQDLFILETQLFGHSNASNIIWNGKKEAVYVGLENQGAICYMNSLLQTLYHIPYFRKVVYHIPTFENDMPSGSISLALQSLFYKFQYNVTSVATKELTKSFGWDTYDLFGYSFKRNLISSWLLFGYSFKRNLISSWLLFGYSFKRNLTTSWLSFGYSLKRDLTSSCRLFEVGKQVSGWKWNLSSLLFRNGVHIRVGSVVQVRVYIRVGSVVQERFNAVLGMVVETCTVKERILVFDTFD